MVARQSGGQWDTSKALTPQPNVKAWLCCNVGKVRGQGLYRFITHKRSLAHSERLPQTPEAFVISPAGFHMLYY